MREIISIGRQFGSGGREIGRKLAEKLGYNFYDRDILRAASRKLNMPEAILERTDESSYNSLLYSLVMSTKIAPFEDRLAKEEANYLMRQAEKGSCVIVGRCANHIFADDPGLLSVFITAPIEKRLERVAQRYNLDGGSAEKMVMATDRKRDNYYYYHTNTRWSDLSQYHFVLDSSVLGTEGTVELLAQIIGMREKK
jgi:cytidylate kinase